MKEIYNNCSIAKIIYEHNDFEEMIDNDYLTTKIAFIGKDQKIKLFEY